MDIKCPHCGTEYEVEKQDMYHYTKCEVCGKGFVAGAETSLLASGNSNASQKAPTGTSRSGRLAPRRTQSESPRAERIAMPSRFARSQGGDTASASSSDVPKDKPAKKKWMILLGMVVGCILVACVVLAGAYLYFGDEPCLNRGVAYYNNRVYSKSYKLLLPLAKKGYARAQLIIGDSCANGLGTFMDTEQAVKWYRQAADQELPEAQHRMFECCRDGVGVERNSENAAKWCRKAADAGLEDAIFDMGMLYVTGIGVEQSAKSAFKWFRKGAERGHPTCLYKFGQCYKLGFGVDKDEDEASKWQNKAVTAWRASANSGDTGSMVRLAELYMEGDVVELDKEVAAKWYRKGAELGNVTAQYKLATCYHNGEGIEEDQEEAAKWMLKAAEKGADRGIQWAMGRYYQEGWGVEKSPAEAVKWFERSAKKGFALAKYCLAMCYMNGEGVKKDEAKAEELLVAAADAGCKEAKDELALIKHEREESARRIAAEKAEKAKQIERLTGIEDIVEERIARINDILAGKLSGEWAGFDAGRISATDSSASVKEEPPAKLMSEQLSDADSLETIERAIANATTEANRLQARLDKINAVKQVYDVKERESRKETCAQCKGTGSVVCSRCKGSGEVVVKDRESCPTCSDGAIYGHKGQIRKEVSCNCCRGTGQIKPTCEVCKGKGRVRISHGGARLDSFERCYNCSGSGKGYSESCSKCLGDGKIEVWQTCPTCQGRGIVVNGSKTTCPVCDGKTNLRCELCTGRGFTYRTKNQ